MTNKVTEQVVQRGFGLLRHSFNKQNFASAQSPASMDRVAEALAKDDVIKKINIMISFTSGFLSGLNAGLQPGI